jgi:CheY-like chemotaxis protein
LLPASGTARGTKRASGRGTILVVDDEEIVRKTAKACLENRGYRVLTAADGLEGVERFREASREIGLVVLDLTMPVMGGEEALRRIVEVRPDVPVVLSSGYTEAEARGRFSIDGLAGFVQKPYSSRVLLEKLESVLKARKAPELRA